MTTAAELPTLWPIPVAEDRLGRFEHRIVEIQDLRGHQLVAACLVDGQTAAVGFQITPSERRPFDVALPDGSRRRFATATASLLRLDERSDLWAMGLAAALGVTPPGVRMCRQLDCDAVSLDGELSALWRMPVRLKLSAMLIEDEPFDLFLKLDLKARRFELGEKWNLYRPRLARALFEAGPRPILAA